MFNFDALKSFVKERLQKVVALEAQMHSEVEEIKGQDHVSIGGKLIPFDPAQKATMINQLRDEADFQIQSVHKEIQDELKSAEKAAYQEYYNAMPRPTIDERGEINDLIQQFNASEGPNKVREFISKRDFHLENETRMARIYVFAGRQLGITATAGLLESPSFDVAEADLIERVMLKTNNLQAKARLEQDELLVRIAPLMKIAQEHVDIVAEARRYYEIFQLQGQLDKLILASGSHMSDPALAENMNFERVSIKNRLFELGANPNTTIFDFTLE